jgi:putative ABC transport system substrate-binding protein
MRRREFITFLGGATVAWPLIARAQSDQVRRIGVLVGLAEDDPQTKARLGGFAQGLERRGWSEGRNVRIDYRFAASPDRYRPLAKELIALQPDVILAHSTPVATALQRESREIPIVFVSVSDPIGSGLISNLARPGGNLTGVLFYEESITGKWLAMLKEIAPQLTRVALIANPKTTAYDYFLRLAKAIAPSLAIELVPILLKLPPTSSAQSSTSRAYRMAVWFCRRITPPHSIAISSSRLQRVTGCRRSTRAVIWSRPGA